MILKFGDQSRRESFLAMVRKERGDIADQLELAETLPHILAPNLSDEQRDWIVKTIGAYGKAWNDIKFDLFR